MIMSDRWAKKWELHDGAGDGYADTDLEPSTDSKDNLSLDSNPAENCTTPNVEANRCRTIPSKLTSGNKLHRKNSNRKNG